MVGLGRRNGMVGIGAPMSAAVRTACTPGIASAAAVSIERMPAMGDRAAHDRGMPFPGAGQIIEILPAAAQEAQFLHPLDRAADEGVHATHGVSLAVLVGNPAALEIIGGKVLTLS